MRRDELRQPLRKRHLGQRLWAIRPNGLVVASVLALAGFSGMSAWLVSKPHPFAGEPIITVAIPPLEELQTAATDPAPEPEEQAASPAQEQVGEAVSIAPAPADNSAVTIEPPVEQDTYQQDAAIIVTPKRALKPAPIAAVAEQSAMGTLPRVADNGKRPADVYARTTPMGIVQSDSPKVAILLGGMGLNRDLTLSASRNLPGEVTFAFAPYGDQLQDQVNKARAQGHEVMLQVPMEPLGFPANNPGPQTLMAEGSDIANNQALRWHMTRFSGYTGLVNYMGGRFMNAPKPLRAVLTETRQRGLYFLEDGSVPISSRATVAKVTNAQTRRADIVLDANATPEAITAQLELVEGQARANGFAIATGSGLEVTIDTVKQWAEGARERGIVLVPVSAVFKGRRS
mgnify:CR=1 FL=1